VSKVLRFLVRPATRLSSWVWRTFLDVLHRSMRHNVTGTASQFAYNAFLATIPFLFVVVTAVRMAGSDAYNSLFDALKGTIPGIDSLEPTFRDATASGATAGVVIIVVGVIAGLYVASNALGALVHGLDRAMHLNHRPWVRGKLINFGFALGTTVLAVVSTLALAGRGKMVRGLGRLIGDERIQGLSDSIVLPIGVGALFAFTLLLYRFGPNGMRLRIRSVVPGAILSVAAWVGTTRLLALYVANFRSFDSVYGTLGAVVLYLTFLYFSGLMFLAGAELNSELIHRSLVRASETDARTRLEVVPPPPPAIAAVRALPAAGPGRVEESPAAGDEIETLPDVGKARRRAQVAQGRRGRR
jgi:membrane protein